MGFQLPLFNKDLIRVARQIGEVVDDRFCEIKRIPVSAEAYKKMLPTVVRHMARHYSGTYDYYGTYSWAHCHKLKILKNGIPVKNCKSVDAEIERGQELYRLGGSDAVEAYRKVFDE